MSSSTFKPALFPHFCSNISNYLPVDNAVPYHPTLIICLIVIIAVIMAIALVGNTLVIITIYCCKRLHTNSGYLMANLAVADLLFSCTIIPSTLANLIYQRNVLTPVLCQINGFLYTLAAGTSIVTVTVITTDRLIAVFKPLHYPRWMSSQFIAILIASSWVFACIHAVLPILGLECFGFGRYTFLPSAASCWVDATLFLGLPNNLFVALTTVEVCLLLGFVVFSYIFMYCKARDSNRKVWSINLSIRHHVVQTNAFNQTRHQPMVCKATKTTLTLVSAFLICWTPAAIESLLALYIPYTIPDMAFLALTWLTYLNSAVNPIIYGLLNRNFTDCLRRLSRHCQSKHCSWIGPLFRHKNSITLVENIRDLGDT